MIPDSIQIRIWPTGHIALTAHKRIECLKTEIAISGGSLSATGQTELREALKAIQQEWMLLTSK